MNTELTAAVLDYIENTSRVHSAMSRKIASLEQKAAELGKNQLSTEALQAFVSKMATGGLIDKLNEAHFKANANKLSPEEVLTRVAALVTPHVDAKSAEDVSPYSLGDTHGAPASEISAEDDAWLKRMASLSKKTKR